MEIQVLRRGNLSSQQALAILRDRHRHASALDYEVDPNADLTFDTTVADWRVACDLVSWRPLALALNEEWQVEIPLYKWKQVLVPEKERTLGDVCQLLSENATVERVEVPTFFGHSCAPAGIFLALRELLARDGADVSRLRPSSDLSDYTIRHWHTFVVSISRLAPGSLPTLKIDHPLCHRANHLLLKCLLAFCCSLALPPRMLILSISLFVLAILAWGLSWVASRRFPEAVTMGELRTFRDLCERMAEDMQCRQGVRFSDARVS